MAYPILISCTLVTSYWSSIIDGRMRSTEVRFTSDWSGCGKIEWQDACWSRCSKSSRRLFGCGASCLGTAARRRSIGAPRLDRPSSKSRSDGTRMARCHWLPSGASHSISSGAVTPIIGTGAGKTHNQKRDCGGAQSSVCAEPLRGRQNSFTGGCSLVDLGVAIAPVLSREHCAHAPELVTSPSLTVCNSREMAASSKIRGTLPRVLARSSLRALPGIFGCVHFPGFPPAQKLHRPRPRQQARWYYCGAY